MDNRAVRLPPSTRRNIFTAHQQQAQSSRRQNVPAIRPDKEASAAIYQQPGEDELVERNSQGDYVTHAPTPVYRNMALVGLGRDGEDDEGMFYHFLRGLYGVWMRGADLW
jgi:hypothetical protein